MNHKELLSEKILNSNLPEDDKQLWIVFISKIEEQNAKEIYDGLVNEEMIKLANRNFQQKIWAAQLNDTQKMSEILNEEEEILKEE